MFSREVCMHCGDKPKWTMSFFLFFFNRHCNPQQEGFLQNSVASGTPTWRTSDLNLWTPATRCPPRLKGHERTPAAEGGTMGEKFPGILPKVAISTSLSGSFTCRKFTTWDRRLYFPSEGRGAEEFFERCHCFPQSWCKFNFLSTKSGLLISFVVKLLNWKLSDELNLFLCGWNVKLYLTEVHTNSHNYNIKSIKLQQDRKCTWKPNTEARSFKLCCLSKAVSITYSECVSLFLPWLHSM